MPIMQSCEEPKKFLSVLYAAIGTLTILYIFFGTFCCMSYGKFLQPLVTENLPTKSVVTSVVKILFCMNVIFGYSIIIAPANRIMEMWLFSGSERFQNGPSWQRKWAKNASRLLIASLAIILALFLAEKLDKFLGLLGALFCAPLALTLPAILHFKALAKTRAQKIADIILIIISFAILVLCTTQSIITW